MRKLAFPLLFLFLASSALAQVPVRQDSRLLEQRKNILSRIDRESRKDFLPQAEKEKLAKQYNFPVVLNLEHGRTADFQYLDEAGKPVYYTTFNISAAVTTGAASLQPGGELGLELTGRGMVVGIYDQTRPKPNHREFENRVTQVDGSTEIISNHATHVTGTILARGLNRNARGMANEATGWAFNWDGDISKMIQNGYDPDLRPGGHIITNHSYGFLIGWYRDAAGNWAWAGNPAINNREDYRFGFYGPKTKQIDELAFSKPYFTMVWAAGNDRNEVGDGSRNADGPDDSIGPEGVAKNNITIGAVSGVKEYRGPNDVVMSPFSGWGPTDDGRIKPDLVAMGVNVFSTAITNEGGADSYATMSGTSMAAPNATGSLFLLQELYHNRNAGRYLRSSTLKGLAIHTAKEAGLAPGPDYVYGWGLLDVKAAAEMIINENNSSRIIRESVLENEQVYEFDFISDGLSPIKATLAWTDPAGTSPSPSLNPANLMLVNDLDLRIIDEDGQVFYPWTLDPDLGSAARAANDADNFRDNVEQILVNTTEAKRYTVRISHKGSLRNNLQAFSLVFNAGVSDGQDKTLYWIGGDGDWNSPTNWSLESNGPSAGVVPDAGTRVVFDDAVSGDSKVTVSDDSEAFSLNFFGNSTIEIDLGSHEVRVAGGFRVSNQITAIKNGGLSFHAESDNENLVDFADAVLDNVQMSMTGGTWRIVSQGILDRLKISNARVAADIPGLQLSRLELGEGALLEGSLEEIIFSEAITIQETSSLNIPVGFRFTGADGSFSDLGENEIPLLANEGGLLRLDGTGRLSRLELTAGETRLTQKSTEVGVLDLGPGAVLNLMDDNSIRVEEDIVKNENAGNATLIKADNKGILIHDPYKKYCFDRINVRNVDLSGEAIVNLGPNSSVINGANWLNTRCDEVLFTHFESRFNCEGALTEFVNTTEGPATQYEWTFGTLGTSREVNPTFVFPREGVYKVTLRASSAGKTMVYEKEIAIGDNILKEPSIVVNGSLLTSLVPSSGYQWYRNGVKIQGAVERSFVGDDEGTYQVAVLNESCNRISAPVVISGIEEEPPMARYGYFVGPNPSSGLLSISINNEYSGSLEFQIYSTSGALVKTVKTQKNQSSFERNIRLDFVPGVYLLLIRSEEMALTQRIIVE